MSPDNQSKRREAAEKIAVQSNAMMAGDTIACGHCVPARFTVPPEPFASECPCLCHRIDLMYAKLTGEARASIFRKYATDEPSQPSSAASVINPLIEFGDHLDYCRLKNEDRRKMSLDETARWQCDCGRDKAVADAKMYMGER